MKTCLKCGKTAAHDFRVLEVQTLHIRDLSGERRVQALGRFQNFSICDSCAASQMVKAINLRDSLLKRCFGYIAALLAGMVLILFLWTRDTPLRFLGLAAIICGVLGIYTSVKAGLDQRKAYLSLPAGEAKIQAAWDVLLQAAPKKSKDSDLSYIPVTANTLAMKNGDLMIEYDLLPEVALKAHAMIHEDEENQDT